MQRFEINLQSKRASEDMTEQTEKGVSRPTNGVGQSYALPIAIVIAGVLIGGAVLLGSNTTRSPVATAGTNQPVEQAVQPTGSLEDVRPVTVEDHIRGNPNAPVKIVEYSDYECHFCKKFHETKN